MSEKRYLIVNADDFGLSSGVNRGIIRAFERGIVTSASLMVRGPAAFEAVAYWREHPQLSLGLHIDLAEWIYRDGQWLSLYEVVPSEDGNAVAREVFRQLATFQELTGCGPTHIDSHQHVHQQEPAKSVVHKMVQELGVPLRAYNSQVRYCGAFYGQTTKGVPLPDLIGVEAFLKILEALPPGITEIGCHPGEGDDLETTYREERTREMRTLCDPRVAAAIETLSIKLCSYATFPAISAARASGRGVGFLENS
jgi:predicted glycoside hydrolase/deacetylase ChbG (UPF0249 family)